MMNLLLVAGGIAALFLVFFVLIITNQRKSRDELIRLEEQFKNVRQQLDGLLLGSQKQNEHLQQHFHQIQLELTQQFSTLKAQSVELHRENREAFDKNQMQSTKSLQESLLTHLTHISQQIHETLNHNIKNIGQQVDKLTTETGQHLKEISGQVEQRLAQGFEKTASIFTQVIERLSLIDAAQKKITELSTNVVSLQEVLADKRSRGAFGEIQLNGLIRNMMPESSFSLQATLSNGKCVDCMLYLPEPTGNMPIDAKFPLENYRKMTANDAPDSERKQAEQLFRQDVRRHIETIAEKYIIPGETAEGAVMFIPAEAVFAQIHGHYPDLVELGYQRRVWMVSPTTLMAVLTTARAVLKDAATTKQVHIIQEHLKFLARDFTRFEKRMDALAKHIDQAHEDVKDVSTSAKKISSRFSKIERVELAEPQMGQIEASLVEQVEAE